MESYYNQLKEYQRKRAEWYKRHGRYLTGGQSYTPVQITKDMNYNDLYAAQMRMNQNYDRTQKLHHEQAVAEQKVQHDEWKRRRGGWKKWAILAGAIGGAMFIPGAQAFLGKALAGLGKGIAGGAKSIGTKLGLLKGGGAAAKGSLASAAKAAGVNPAAYSGIGKAGIGASAKAFGVNPSAWAGLKSGSAWAKANQPGIWGKLGKFFGIKGSGGGGAGGFFKRNLGLGGGGDKLLSPEGYVDTRAWGVTGLDDEAKSFGLNPSSWGGLMSGSQWRDKNESLISKAFNFIGRNRNVIDKGIKGVNLLRGVSQSQRQKKFPNVGVGLNDRLDPMTSWSMYNSARLPTPMDSVTMFNRSVIEPRRAQPSALNYWGGGGAGIWGQVGTPLGYDGGWRGHLPSRTFHPWM